VTAPLHGRQQRRCGQCRGGIALRRRFEPLDEQALLFDAFRAGCNAAFGVMKLFQ
jgi:hypothetical protein